MIDKLQELKINLNQQVATTPQQPQQQQGSKINIVIQNGVRPPFVRYVKKAKKAKKLSKLDQIEKLMKKSDKILKNLKKKKVKRVVKKPILKKSIGELDRLAAQLKSTPKDGISALEALSKDIKKKFNMKSHKKYRRGQKRAVGAVSESLQAKIRSVQNGNVVCL
jgi:hypothetical protein